MELTAIDRSTQASPAPAVAAPGGDAAERREVVRAIQALNSAEMFGEENLLTFRRDPDTHRMVIRVVNRKTGEVVSQIPPEYVLRVAKDLESKAETGRAGTILEKTPEQPMSGTRERQNVP